MRGNHTAPKHVAAYAFPGAVKAMEEFDQLPREIRLALHDAPMNLATKPILDGLARGMTVDDVLRELRAWEARIKVPR